MISLMRTIVDLPKEQIKRLDEYRRKAGISRTEAVRRAVALFLPASSKDKNWLTDHPAIGTWKRRDGVTWQRKLRSEWNE
jgi:metal-responsive CopG/Arc/MetJ family transcriptional regulator